MSKVNADVVIADEAVVVDSGEIVASKPLPKLGRVWEIDALRGALILLVVFDHFMYDVLVLGRYFESEFWQWLYIAATEYRSNIGFLGVLREGLLNGFIMCFLLLSGISSSFSRCNWARGVKMGCFALLLTGVTQMVCVITGNAGMAINFNVIHVVAICVLFYSLLEWIQSKATSMLGKNLFGLGVILIILASFVVGYYYFYNPHTDWNDVFGMFFFEHVSNYALSPGDHLPLFPGVGWFLIGAFLGKSLYPQRRTLFPNANAKVFKPLTICGSYSLWVYFGSQVLVYGGMYLFAVILGVM